MSWKPFGNQSQVFLGGAGIVPTKKPLSVDTALDTGASKKGQTLVNRLGNHQAPSG